ncbi:MAG: DUF3450 domain-containing protein [Desulfobacterales bacterium]|nr:DUF3450 domain-containing protein [Desulfobacterales bacterium]
MKRLCVIMFSFLYLFLGSGTCEDFSDQIQKPIKKSLQSRQQTQKAEDQWAEERVKLEVEFKALQNQQEILFSTKEDLNKKLAFRTQQIKTLETEIKEISRISDELSPYLNVVYAKLIEFINNDLPFLTEERRHRVQKIQTVLDDEKVPTSEKFRKVMEALFVEAEYGNTVEIYREKISVTGKEILADIFRLGRLSLFFQSIDKKTTGFYDGSESVWKLLPQKYNKSIQMAMDMGAKRRSVDLLSLPVGRVVVQ